MATTNLTKENFGSTIEGTDVVLVDSDKIIALTFVIGAALAAIAGVLVALF